MADNIDVTPGTGKTIAADDIGGVLHQRVKLAIGADGSATDAIGDKGNSTAAVLRVAIADDDTNASRIKSSTIGGVTPTSLVKATTTFSVGGQYNATLPTFTDGDQGGIQLDSSGRLLATLQSSGPVSPGTAATKSNLTGGVYNSSAPTLTNGQQAALQIDASGRLLTTVGAALPAGTNSIGAVTNTNLTNALVGKYKTVAASQTATVLGATGATGDYLVGLLVVPATLSPGNVIILDNATSITVFAGGSNSLSNLVPFFIPLSMASVSGAWKVTTGADVSIIAIGNFT